MKQYTSIGEIIRYYRTQKGISQEELAFGICDRKYLSKIERDKCAPTLEIINLLSEKLNVPLYSTYSLMLRHKNIETHKRIETLNAYFFDDKKEDLPYFIHEYENLPEFQDGEPAQILLYAKAIYLSNVENKFADAIQLSLEALNMNPDFSMDNLSANTIHLTGLELRLLNMISVCYFRDKNFDEGKRYYYLCVNHLKEKFFDIPYVANRNEPSELKLLVAMAYNYFVFLRDEENFTYADLDYALMLLKKFHSTYLLPELLLCKSYQEIQNKNYRAAQEYFYISHSLGSYIYSKERQKEIENNVLGTLAAFLNQQS